MLLSGASDVVDIFNASSRSWRTARLSTARADLSAASLPALGLAFFAGSGRPITSVCECDVKALA